MRAPAALYPPVQYPLYRRLGGSQGRSGQMRKISPPPGFDPRTVQPVASRYTDYVTRLLDSLCEIKKTTGVETTSVGDVVSATIPFAGIS